MVFEVDVDEMVAGRGDGNFDVKDVVVLDDSDDGLVVVIDEVMVVMVGVILSDG